MELREAIRTVAYARHYDHTVGLSADENTAIDTLLVAANRELRRREIEEEGGPDQ
jgi:hypothetical protein